MKTINSTIKLLTIIGTCLWLSACFFPPGHGGYGDGPHDHYQQGDDHHGDGDHHGGPDGQNQNYPNQGYPNQGYQNHGGYNN